MKKFFKKIIYGVAWLFSLILNNCVLGWGRKFICYIHAANFRKKVGRCGKNLQIGRRNCFENLYNVFIGDNFKAGDGFWLCTYPSWGGVDYEYKPRIVIGDNVSFSRLCHVGAIGEIVIGDNVLFGSNVLINDHSHGYTEISDIPRIEQPLVTKDGGIKIGGNTWVCDNVCILPGVHIGKNCIVGAGAVVTKSFDEDGVLIAGNPARIIKKLPRAGEGQFKEGIKE